MSDELRIDPALEVWYIDGGSPWYSEETDPDEEEPDEEEEEDGSEDGNKRSERPRESIRKSYGRINGLRTKISSSYRSA